MHVAEDEQPLFTYQKTARFFAQVASGLEKEGKEELAELGGMDIDPAFRGIYFKADLATLYRINYQSRLCSRILAPLLTFDCHSTKYLHKTAMKIPWEIMVRKDGTFAVNATVAHSKIKHSQYAALCLKDAVVDSFKKKYGSRPDVDRHDPDLLVNLHIENNRAVISIDTSGGSLHRRGYRQKSIAAPMQETLAAAIVRLSGWDGSKPLVDPMCGSGTLLCEALMSHCRIPAGYLRKRFGFESMSDFDQKVWQGVRAGADKGIRKLPGGLISGYDIDGEVVAAARSNCGVLPEGKGIAIRKSSWQKIASLENSVIISNPPYGIRLGRKEGLNSFMKEFGDFLKQRCRGSEAYLYFGKREMLKMIGLKPSWKRPLKTGGLDGVLAKYEMY